ncbi:hypothetical protein ABFS82_06G053800 [Erythranthe guttata]|uniref:pectinesterase n=1 Tax=Erythranthe guttata TaxID=4155 RepID=A0A022PX92_ERYGU|nr:PREDICTED: pectinesterase 2-like [Erythranthe guttata]EYU20154.1 hypothetical protein MIMGU_mgv1a008641mg [Erythranthe guttata]|eukprot:XP_012858215.1 PREDICTED: pectinesterase 2-like [Erythranthe guttata]
METKSSYIFTLNAVLVTVLLSLPVARSGGGSEPIPADASQINSWFNKNVGDAASRKATLAPELAAAEANPKVIKVRADGSGDFKTINDAVKSIPDGNKNRVIVSIGPGKYKEKVTVGANKPFVTLRGDAGNMPTIVYDDTAKKSKGVVYSATLSAESDYFSAVNLKVVNTAPRPDGKMVDAQAVALKIIGKYASIYNCKLYGFQDTLFDDKGKHFYKDCYIEGTYDFIWGSAASIYLNTELHIISGDPLAVIAANARSASAEPNGYVFAHCKVTGTGAMGYLGRSWYPYARVVYAFSDLGDAVNPDGWYTGTGKDNKTVYFGEYNNKGSAGKFDKRASFAKKLSDAEVKPFISLDFIQGSTWLLPPS